MKTRKFTKEELSRYNGRYNKQTFIAYKGKVYDVSESFLWQKGKHQATHFAGKDLTEEFSQVPHGHDLLEKFPIVGVLIED
jgi:predicted heme/steroid binding protein